MSYKAVPTELPEFEQKTEYFCANKGDDFEEREFYEYHLNHGAWIIYPDGNTNGIEMRYYDGYFDVDGLPAGWYCDNCLEYIYDCASESFGEMLYNEAIKIFESHLSITLEEFLNIC